MKRYLFLLSLFICQLAFTGAAAQTTDFQKTVACYKKAKKATADVVKTVHKQALANDVVTRGGTFVISPEIVSISTNKGLDKLVMKGTKFTMSVNGRERTTDSKKNPQFATFHEVLTSIVNGGSTDIEKLPEVDVNKSGTNLTVTITPTAKNKKSAKRMMFQKIMLVMDTKTSKFKQLRMTERNGDYTDYEFSNFRFQ